MTQSPNTPRSTEPPQPQQSGQPRPAGGETGSGGQEHSPPGEAQAQQAAATVRKWADDLAGMAERAPGDSPARGLVSRAADGGHRAADYLEQRGTGGVAEDLRGFARERPAAFLGGAALAGFALGRVAKAGMAQTAHRKEEG